MKNNKIFEHETMRHFVALVIRSVVLNTHIVLKVKIKMYVIPNLPKPFSMQPI